MSALRLWKGCWALRATLVSWPWCSVNSTRNRVQLFAAVFLSLKELVRLIQPQVLSLRTPKFSMYRISTRRAAPAPNSHPVCTCADSGPLSKTTRGVSLFENNVCRAKFQELYHWFLATSQRPKMPCGCSGEHWDPRAPLHLEALGVAVDGVMPSDPRNEGHSLGV